MKVDTGLDVFVHLQWNDPFGASGNDYDLFICPAGLKPIKFNLQNDLCAGSDRLQDGNNDPDEAAFLFHPGEADIYLRKYSGDPKRLEMFIDGAEIREHGVPEGGILGHPAASEVLAVGAIDAADPGHDDPEYFSDKGPSIISHPTPESRNKPDVMGIDGVLVTGSGNFGRPFPDGPGNLFFATSAAAPHVAAIAALVIEAQRLADPSMTQKEVADSVTQRLRDTAIDLRETGHDNATGYGRADALAAIESIAESSENFNLTPTSRFPATYSVDSTGDGAYDTTDGTCDDGNGNCTLRAAIHEAN